VLSCLKLPTSPGMFRHPLLRDIAWISLLKLLVLVLIYALFFAPAHRMPLDVWGHIAATR
jgi:uncharacterized membrane protein